MKKIFIDYCNVDCISICNVNSQTRKIVVDKQKDSVRTIEALGTCVHKFTDTKILNIAFTKVNKYIKYRWPSNAPTVVNELTKIIKFNVNDNSIKSFEEKTNEYEVSNDRY